MVENQEQPTYSLQEISSWDEAEGGMKKHISLPSVQRSFVWKPNQIEDMWDSLLRIFPVGAFVLSKKRLNASINEGDYDLLDGQQRASVICLGFGTKAFRASKEEIKIFIDIIKPKEDDTRKYMFRVITKSHPWGYQRMDNTKTLRSEQRKKAMELYPKNVRNPKDLGSYYPYDADLPVPLEYFIKSVLGKKSIDELIRSIEGWQHWGSIKARYKSKARENEEDSEGDERQKILSDAKIHEGIEVIYNAVKYMIDIRRIPALYLDLDEISKNQSKSEILGKESQNEEDEKGKDQIENLFVRLNSSGTPLRGEELIYSILKTHIKPGLQKRIEKECEGLFKSSRFIILMCGLYQNQKRSGDSISLKIKPRQFQKTMAHKEEGKRYEEYLEDVLDKKEYYGKSLLEYIRHLIDYNASNNLYGLPYLIKSRISESAPEIMFMLMYRIKIKKDMFALGTVMHRKMLGMITLFAWIGGLGAKGHSRLLKTIWLAVKESKYEIFWSSATVQRARINDSIIRCPKVDVLKKIKKYKPYMRNSKIYEEYSEYSDYMSIIFNQRYLVLYAQRKALDSMFKEEEFSMEDMNNPFDWDHISAKKYVHKIWGIADALRYDMYDTNGNIRAWPYYFNRMDQDKTPAIKLDPLNKEKNPELTDDEISKRKKAWEEILQDKISDSNDLKDRLMKFSYCDPKWGDCDYTDLRSEWKGLYGLILKRNIEMCQEWYKELLIDDLVTENIGIDFESIINKKKWRKTPPAYKKMFEYDKYVAWFTTPIKVDADGNAICLYIEYKNTKDRECILGDYQVRFGLYEPAQNGYLNKIKLSKKQEEESDRDSATATIWGYFTLVTHDESSYIELFKKFREWLDKISDPNIRKLHKYYAESMAKKYQKKIL